MRIAVDVTGAESGIETIVVGCLHGTQNTGISAVLIGPGDEIKASIRSRVDVWPELIRVVDRGSKPALSGTIYFVKSGGADGMIAIGSTANVVAAVARRSGLGLLPGVERPAIAVTICGHRDEETLLLDVGAAVDCTTGHLVSFARMGAAYMASHKKRATGDIKIAALSIGSEKFKGNRQVREFNEAMYGDPRFIGNVEPWGLYKGGEADVVVCDGHVGNILLKTHEGLLGACLSRLCSNRTIAASVEVGQIVRQHDSTERGLAVLLGPKGLCMVGHASSSSAAIASGFAQVAAIGSGFITDLEREFR